MTSLLERGIRTGICRLPDSGNDGVRLLDFSGLRDRDLRAVFLLGMLDGSVPRHALDDPILGRSEREALNPHLPYPLELEAGGARERYLFYSAVSSAGERLYLCHPSSDALGRESRRSQYLDEVIGLLGPGMRRLSRGFDDIAPPIDDAETVDSLVARTVADCSTTTDDRSKAVAAAAYNLLLDAGMLPPGAFSCLGEEPSDVDTHGYAYPDEEPE
jgi:ATP-dependent helicase/DNAse subunit B